MQKSPALLNHRRIDVAPTPTRGRAAIPVRPTTAASKVVVIGASTGGPQALGIVLKGLGPALCHAPALVVLHIPSQFTEVVAEYIRKSAGVPARIARAGETIEKGQVYFAPGDLHLGLMRTGDGPAITLLDDPPQNFCKPSVDILFRSAARCFGADTIGVMLTGMGSDGLDGSRAIVQAGGKIIAQDAASSAVWGMPGAVVNNGLAHAVLPLGEIAQAVCDLIEPPLRVREKSL